MIPKTLRLYVGGSGAQRKVLLENRSNNSGLLLQADVCAELRKYCLSSFGCLCVLMSAFMSICWDACVSVCLYICLVVMVFFNSD